MPWRARARCGARAQRAATVRGLPTPEPSPQAAALTNAPAEVVITAGNIRNGEKWTRNGLEMASLDGADPSLRRCKVCRTQDRATAGLTLEVVTVRTIDSYQ